MQQLKWLSRVPLTVKHAKQLISQLTDKNFTASEIAGYRWSQQLSKYGGFPQRWLVVESEIRRQADLNRLDKKLEKAETEANKQLRKLGTQKFAFPPDAIAAATQLAQKLKYHKLTNIKTTELGLTAPKQSAINIASAHQITYQVQANLERDQRVIATESNQAGRFVLATNVLDAEELSNDQLLDKYKEQQSAERGFGFLKDPLFFTDSVFLKSPERVEAIALLMGLCLLVYTLAQRQLRQTLKQAQSGLKNQLGKLTSRPTLRWIFQCFQSVHFLMIHGIKQIFNLTPERLEILSFFPHACRQYYLLL